MKESNSSSSGIKVFNITNFSDGNNYGQRLQTYALQKFVKNTFDVDVLTLDPRSFQPNSGKSRCFYAFEKKHINILRLTSLADKSTYNADIILVGGDQNWNYCHPYYTGKFCNGRAKLVSYSSSACYSKINRGGSDPALVSQLAGYRMVSFREKTSYDKFKTLIKIETLVKKPNPQINISYHVDPVFLLTPDEWSAIQKKPEFIDGSGVFDFAYYIGKEPNAVSADENQVKEYVYYGNSQNLDNIPPDEFLWMIARCRRFKTSSFHGVAFGVLFGKKVEAPPAFLGDLRVKNLVETLGLSVEDGVISCSPATPDCIKRQRARAIEWLRECLSLDGMKYACYADDADVRGRSASGGAAALTAKHIIDHDGVVYGAAYADDFRSVKTVKVSSMDDYYAKISKSKYSKCEMPDMDEVKADVESGKPVLFIGCPCQIKTLKAFLGKDYENLLTMDLVCNGWSRPELLKEFIDEQEQAENSKVAAIDMRPNHAFGFYLKFENGKEKTLADVVTRTFVCNKENYIDECKSCGMHNAGRGDADLTVGDFWDYHKHKDVCDRSFKPEKGTNIIFINTKKGLDAFKRIKSFLKWRYLI